MRSATSQVLKDPQLLGTVDAPVFDPPDLSGVAGTYDAESFGNLAGVFGESVAEVVIFSDGRVRITDESGDSG